jgi:hypothetical protein
MLLDAPHDLAGGSVAQNNIHGFDPVRFTLIDLDSV